MSQHDRNDANTPVDGQPNAPVRACLRRPAVPVPTHNPAPTMSEPPVIDGFYDISIDENWPGAPMATAGDAPAYVPTLADLADAGDMDDFGDDELDFDEMDDEHELIMQEADIDNADHARDKEEGWYYDDEDEDAGDPRDAGEADDEDGEDDGTAQQLEVRSGARRRGDHGPKAVARLLACPASAGMPAARRRGDQRGRHPGLARGDADLKSPMPSTTHPSTTTASTSCHPACRWR